jgi:MoxR-like ATPase
MAKHKVRNMFAGGNTSKGFFSFFSYIINWEVAGRVFILKGGPGAGKSTFIKRTAEKMQEYGYDIEYFHCSSDNESLDGVAFPDINVALVDGTAPHADDL